MNLKKLWWKPASKAKQICHVLIATSTLFLPSLAFATPQTIWSLDTTDDKGRSVKINQSVGARRGRGADLLALGNGRTRGLPRSLGGVSRQVGSPSRKPRTWALRARSPAESKHLRARALPKCRYEEQ
ncbi:hypothetical protein AVEN_61914-1 [Araneus ventricosus]|uniref:Uncharacterized protein n=1 Tax=Araneus ventricosus TaxID=182803 RepID=A0A4Y2JDK8_ARAVE|nr:hypothetical protein AVEN_61914-1 [Araneus ventricosus]